MSRKSSRAAVAATAALQQPTVRPGRFKPGDRVRMRDGTAVFTVIDSDGSLVKLLSETGAECRAGWRVLERCP
jgi:hypothetical protein